MPRAHGKGSKQRQENSSDSEGRHTHGCVLPGQSNVKAFHAPYEIGRKRKNNRKKCANKPTEIVKNHSVLVISRISLGQIFNDIQNDAQSYAAQ